MNLTARKRSDDVVEWKGDVIDRGGWLNVLVVNSSSRVELARCVQVLCFLCVLCYHVFKVSFKSYISMQCSDMYVINFSEVLTGCLVAF